MTDENLKALEEKARAALDLEGNALDLAEGVLALLERVRKAESDVSDAAEWARALEDRIDSWRELHKEAQERARAAEARVSDLQKEHEEDQGVIRVWRGRTERAEAWANHLRLVGTGLANAAYNLKQQTYIPEDRRRSLDEGQRAWDAVLSGGATPTTIPARRPSPSTDPVDMARREGLVAAMLIAADVEREEKAEGFPDAAHGAEEVKDRIKGRIRWLDEGTK